MSVETDSDAPMATTGVDAIDYSQFGHLQAERGILVYGLDDEGAWLQSDTSVDLEAER